MPIHPFNLITVEGAPSDRQTISASLAQWDKLGTRAWCGYSFSWMACLRARVGDPEGAFRNLDIYTRAFTLRNGFHANGDQTKSGFSDMTYRPFTLEGNLLAMEAVHEMLIQSWSSQPGDPSKYGTIRLFPAIPWQWHEASFTDLRTEGAHRVSARRENNATTWFRIVAGSTGRLALRDNFGGRPIHWKRGTLIKEGSDLVLNAKRGDVIEATIDKPAQVTAPAKIRN